MDDRRHKSVTPSFPTMVDIFDRGDPYSTTVSAPKRQAVGLTRTLGVLPKERSTGADLWIGHSPCNLSVQETRVRETADSRDWRKPFSRIGANSEEVGSLVASLAMQAKTGAPTDHPYYPWMGDATLLFTAISGSLPAFTKQPPL